MIRVGIVGGTGYTGVELLRLLAVHPQAEVRVITSRKEAGMRVAEMFPSLRGLPQFTSLRYSDAAQADLTGCEVVFFATPHGVAMAQARELTEGGAKIVDLAADFRLKDPAEFEQWYKMPHACPDLLAESIYGLPEMHRDAIRRARIVGNPGCYPTAIQLGFLPLVETGIVDPAHLIADAKSGVSGAGRKAELGLMFSEAADNFKAYNVGGHRHHRHSVRRPEVNLCRFAAGLRYALRNRAVCRRHAPRKPSRYAVGARFQCLPDRRASATGRRHRGHPCRHRQPGQRRRRPGGPEHEPHVRPARGNRP